MNWWLKGNQSVGRNEEIYWYIECLIFIFGWLEIIVIRIWERRNWWVSPSVSRGGVGPGVHLEVGDGRPIPPSGQDGGLVQEVREVGSWGGRNMGKREKENEREKYGNTIYKALNSKNLENKRNKQITWQKWLEGNKKISNQNRNHSAINVKILVLWTVDIGKSDNFPISWIYLLFLFVIAVPLCTKCGSLYIT